MVGGAGPLHCGLGSCLLLPLRSPSRAAPPHAEPHPELSTYEKMEELHLTQLSDGSLP